VTASDTHADLIRRIKILSERLWEDHCKAPDNEQWLSNFDGRHNGNVDTEHLHALHLLASVSYFGLRELRVLLRSMFRDNFRYPIVQAIREEMAGSKDCAEIERRFQGDLGTTRFIGMGNPAESGTHLLYYFRQENRLPKSLFVHQHELLNSAATDPDVDFSVPSLKRVVFVDDLCGSGNQSVEYSRTVLRDLRAVALRNGRSLEFQYLVLFGTAAGLDRARNDSDFDVVEAVSEIDDTYATFGDSSRVFRKPPAEIDIDTSKRIATGYGEELWATWPLGYENGQLLLAFHHNVPDNSLPILWFDEGEPPWSAVFPRYPKIY
jgi:hypothetical protein